MKLTLKQAKEKHRLKQKDIAEKMELSRQAIWRYEKNPSDMVFSDVMKMADIFGYSVSTMAIILLNTIKESEVNNG